jgi:hypothetical protein
MNSLKLPFDINEVRTRDRADRAEKTTVSFDLKVPQPINAGLIEYQKQNGIGNKKAAIEYIIMSELKKAGFLDASEKPFYPHLALTGQKRGKQGEAVGLNACITKNTNLALKAWRAQSDYIDETLEVSIIVLLTLGLQASGIEFLPQAK